MTLPDMPYRQQQTVDAILATVRGTVYRDDDGDVIIMLSDDHVAVAVDREGNTSSTWLVAVPPADIATLAGLDVTDIAGWTTGWSA